MTVGSISGSGVQTTQMASTQSSDALSKSLQQQIAEKKMQLQQISSNQELSPEEKMQKRQELQQQIFELQNQLRQHEMEKRKEAQESQNNEMEEMLGGKRESVTQDDEEPGYTVSREGMAAMISADSSLSQAKVQGSVATKLKGEAGNLQGEAKLDAGRGGSSEDKMNAAAALEQKASQAEVSQVKGLNKAVKKLSDAAESDREKAEGTDSEEMKDIHAQYGDNVTVDISGEALAALAESQNK